MGGGDRVKEGERKGRMGDDRERGNELGSERRLDGEVVH